MIQPLHLSDDRPSFAISVLILGETFNFKCGSVLLIDESIIILIYEEKKQTKTKRTIQKQTAPDISKH